MARKIYKRDLVQFIIEKKHDALNMLDTKYNDLIAKRKLKILEEQGFGRRIVELQVNVNQQCYIARTLAQDLKDNNVIRYNAMSHNSAEKYLNQIQGDSIIVNRIVSASTFDDLELQNLRKEKDKEVNAVEANYTAVISTIQSFTKIEKSIEYAESLGFDLSSIERGQEVTALIPAIDISKLYLNILKYEGDK